MNALLKITNWLSDTMKIVGAVCLVGMTAITCVDVVGRFFGHPILGSVEIVGYLSIMTVVMALPYTHQMKGHIGVEILVRMFSERTQAIIDIVMGIVSMGLIGLITWRMAVYGHTMYNSGQVSMNLQMPEHIFIFICSVCFFVFFLMILLEIFQNITTLRGKK